MAAYSQWQAYKSLFMASFRSMTKSPSAIVFTLGFPLVFILVFGFLGDSFSPSVTLSIAPGSDTNNVLYQSLKKMDNIALVNNAETKVEVALGKGQITSVIKIDKAADGKLMVHLRNSSIQPVQVKILHGILQQVLLQSDNSLQQVLANKMSISEENVDAREFKTIDFILPGQLGFSLLASSIFGTAFVFYGLRQTLVMKRFFATPVRKGTMLLAEASSRMFFQLLGAAIIIIIGKYAFGFTLVNGFVTFLNMMIISLLALMVFMSFGFIISGLAKSEATIPPLANLITLPQFLLAGTFFSVSAFPQWLQYISNILPLTYYNQAVRDIAFEGASLWDVKLEIGILLLWGVVGYVGAAKFFKWE